MSKVQPPLSTSDSRQKLRKREKIAYGVGDIANGIAVSSIAFWFLMYLTDVAGLPGTLAGTALMVGRIWDAVTDPIAGWLTDRTESRWGKRRPFLLFGALTYGIAFSALWMVPVYESDWQKFFYVLFAFLIFNTALTLVFIPYTSLTAAMTDDYQERVSLTGYRMTCSQMSFLVGGALPPLLVGAFLSSTSSGSVLLDGLGLQQMFGEWGGTARQGYAVLGVLFGSIIIGSTLVTFFGTRERVSPDAHSAHEPNPLRYISGLVVTCRDNIAFRASVLIKLLSTAATTLIGVNIPYYLAYVLKMPEQKTWVLGALFLAAIAATPWWVMMARRHGKAETFRYAMAGYIGVLLLLIVLPAQPTLLIYPIAILAGFFHSAALMLPWSILPDVVEYDELRNGIRREGLLFGGSAFAYKFASAFALFVVGVLLDLLGYNPNGEQSETAIWGITLAIALAPSIFLFFSIRASLSYPLSPARYQEVLAELQQRRAAQR